MDEQAGKHSTQTREWGAVTRSNIDEQARKADEQAGKADGRARHMREALQDCVSCEAGGMPVY